MIQNGVKALSITGIIGFASDVLADVISGLIVYLLSLALDRIINNHPK